MSLSTSLHLQDNTPIHTHLYTYDNTETPALGAVEIDRGLNIVGKTPAQLLRLAEALTDTARRLSDALDKAAAREINQQAADDMRADVQADADADARAAGFCDDFCRSEIETDALIEEIGR